MGVVLDRWLWRRGELSGGGRGRVIASGMAGVEELARVAKIQAVWDVEGWDGVIVVTPVPEVRVGELRVGGMVVARDPVVLKIGEAIESACARGLEC